MGDHEMEQYYRERAPEYEQIYYRDDPARRGAIDAEVARLKKLVAGKAVLELACGTGYWTAGMSRTAESILASDLSGEMIKEARSKTYDCPVEFVAADMFSHDFGLAAFDVVALGFWYSHQPRQELGPLYEVLERPLKPGGRIWMVENNPPAEGSANHSVRKDKYGNNFKKRYLDDGREFVILKNYFERAELAALLSERYEILSLDYGTYYWSAVLAIR